MSTPISGLVKQIHGNNGNSWLIGQRFVLHQTKSAEEPLWRDSDGNCYSLAPLSDDIPPATEIPSGSFPYLLHDCANISAVWDFGDVVLKIKLFQTRKDATREHATLDWLANQKLNFAIPQVLHYSADDDKSYLFSTRLPGITLNSAWPSMDEDHRQYYVQQVANICIQLSSYTSRRIGGIDGSQLHDSWLDPFSYDFRSETLLANSTQLGMSSTEFFFSHNDLAPGNIIVDPQEKHLVGIIDWESAGFVPREWISTKFAVGWGLDLEVGNISGLSETDWRERVHQALRENGFPDVSDTWKKWYKKRCSDLEKTAVNCDVV
ncbi:hypothetical protein FOQG_18596 [Fusarium oxysporum f. sp. raphani 54005]|uniref:Aminoglycoside phosphotransferase domain-containing protein n=1 Tax=Fusarium oxysporum f. sp. raphani 54005 TaxID=1089458 RepID=X0B4L8_FUSOX|nr:hypothetical protein FOQG_18596 [Fusarium oxysporum f. sp. raphani 54005]